MSNRDVMTLEGDMRSVIGRVNALESSRYVVGYCHTNLDEWRSASWPTRFVSVPNIGEQVEGRKGEYRPVLTVVAVTHELTNAGEPMIRVELHKKY